MRLLLDTHAFLWWLAGSPRLSRPASRAIGKERNQVFVSAASVWEISTKIRLGRLEVARTVATDLAGAVASQGFGPVDMTVAHAQRAGDLSGDHGDPFDRMLAAQALCEGLRLVSNDRVFDGYGVRRLW